MTPSQIMIALVSEFRPSRWFPLSPRCLRPRFKGILSALLVVLLAGGCSQAEDSLDEGTADEVMEAYQSGDYSRVIELTADVPEGDRWERVRAMSFQRRGETRFFEGEIQDAIADFDAVIEILPQQDPHHWQRGLAYYYAGEYEKGKAQFERHQTVNSQDVENAVWHFLCSVRAPGGSVEAAQEEMIPIEGDRRVPMKEVHDLFSGRGAVETVLDAAAPDEDGILSERERNHLCYAHLYLALYFEAIGEREKMVEHIRLAAQDYAMDHYMGKTAQVHFQLRESGGAPESTGPAESDDGSE